MARAKTQKAWDELVQSCPLLFQGAKGFHFQCNDGWLDLIAKLCLKLELLIAAIPEEDRFTERESLDGEEWGGAFMYGVAQVKEKYGTLRFYMDYEMDGAEDLISDAEFESSKTCEVCGKPGETRNGSWISTLCNDHYGEDPA